VKWLTPRLGAQPLHEPALLSARDAAIPKAMPRATQMGWRIGQNVVHAKFGQGVIVDAEGQGPDARLQINFGRQGMKWLALEYAKLSAA
jgi:DNA helicase-2/ATP-dependent DNA helicase PcrA